MSSIRSNLKTSAIWSTVFAISRVGLQFLSTVILAHMLGPDVYGLMGMMAIFIAIAETLMDAGLGGALIKKKNATAIDYGTLLTYNLSMSVILYLAIFFAAPYVSDFYQKPILTLLLRLYGIVILVEAISLVPKVYLIKNLQMKKYAIASLLSGTIGLICAIIMAKLKYGVYSLIWQLIISSIVYSALLIIASHYRVTFAFSFQSFKEMFGFGFNTTSANFIKNFAENIFTNVVAKVAPLKITGYYNQSFKLQNVVASVQTTIIDNALFPVLSKEDDKRIIDISVRVNYLAAYGAVLLYALLIFNADLIVRLMLGEVWVGMVPYFKLLLIGGIFQSFTAFNRNIFKTIAETLSIVLCELFSLIALVFLLITMKYGVNAIIYTFIGYAVIRWQVSVILLANKRYIGYFPYLKRLFLLLIPPLLAIIVLGYLSFWGNPYIDGIIQSTFLVLFLIVYGELSRNNEYNEFKLLIINSLKRWGK